MAMNGSEICTHTKSVHEHKKPVITIRTKKTFRDRVQYLKVCLISLGIALAFALTVYIDIYAAKFVMRNLFPKTEIADGRHTEGTTVSDGCITDTVTYTGLTAGEKYTIKATLVNKKTLEPYNDECGNPITVSVSFISEHSAGEIVIRLPLPAEQIDSAVLFEELNAPAPEFTIFGIRMPHC